MWPARSGGSSNTRAGPGDEGRMNTPIAIGLVIFGWYAYRGEYDHLPHRNKDL